MDLYKIVQRSQYSFIKRHTIHDCLGWVFQFYPSMQCFYCFIKRHTIQSYLGWASNFIHQCNASGCECVILKVDLEGAFDTIEHHIILAVL
jgi:sorbitol-specific phosphotransferase system component IIC